MNIRHPLSILAIALSAALPMGVATAARAQTQAQAYRPGPAIESLGVDQQRSVAPGSELAFSLNGTPGAAVTLQIDGATGDVRMNEVRSGVYEGRYTVRSRDQLNDRSVVTASLVKDGLVTRATMRESLVLGARDIPAAADHITAFSVNAPDRVRPGDEVGFNLNGVRGGKARVAIEGVSRAIPLTETRPGVYEGSYVVRRSDRVRDNMVAVGYLMSNRVETSERYEQHAATDRRNDRQEERRDRRDAVASCAACGSVESVNVVEIKDDTPNVVGTIAGGLLGGVIGNQVGGGTGRDVARVLGAVGGAYAGNRIENNMEKKTVFRVQVRLDSGATQTLDYAENPALTAGMRVKVENGVLVRI